MRRNQKGFTLVELIIAVAIMSIVTLAVCGFIIVGSRSYASANTDIMLQQEAQLALNQISDVIIDTTDSINYGGKDDTASEMQMVLKDSEFVGEPTEKCLVVINKADGNNDNPSYWFGWNKEDEVLYFNDSDDVIDESQPEPDFKEADKAVLAEHVREFHIDISQFEQNRVVMVSMTFAQGNREYTTSNNITVRNRVALNKVTVEPMKKASEFTIDVNDHIILEPGDSYPLTTKSVDSTDGDTAVRWEFVSAEKNGTSITETETKDGSLTTLTIGRAETREYFDVKVSRKAYTDERSAKKVRVYIKRVNEVKLSCAEDSVKAGSTVTIDGSVIGYQLGNRCSREACAADNTGNDHNVCDWTIVSGPAVIESSGDKEAVIKVDTTAKAGDQIVIEAASVLSKAKGYGSKEDPQNPPAKGTLTLTVTKGKNGDVPIQSGFKFGTDNDPGPLDYMRSHLKTDWYRYVYCVRVRELDSTTAADDQVVMYYTTGANERFNPDLFGLELDRSYYVFFQVLDPVSKETREKKANNEIGSYYEDDPEVIVNEYINNIDPSTGKYIGDKYEADDYYYGLLTPPLITLKYNGVTYPNDDSDYCERYSFVTGGETVMGQPELSDILNVERNIIMHNIRYTLYEGEGDDISGWTRIWGFDGDTLQYDSGSNTVPGGVISFNPDSSQFLKRDINNHNLAQACGTYHIVPGYVYANDPNIRGGYDYLYKHNLRGDYEKHYYEQEHSTITIKIDMGLNLELPSENGEERWTNFPVPTDRSFPFELKSSESQATVYNFTKYTKNGDWAGSLDNIIVECRYVPGVGGSADSYTITLSSRQFDGTQIVNHTYGKYSCKVGKDTWERMAVESDTTEPLNLTFTRNGNTYLTYFPSSAESGFPFKPVAGEQTAQYQLIAFNKYNSGDVIARSCTVKGKYSNGSYSIELVMTEKAGTHKATIYHLGTYAYDGKIWNQTKAGTTSIEAVWGPRIFFEYNNNSCMMEMALPSESGFPQLTDNEYTDSGSMQYFLESDTYGENVWNYTYGAITRKYTYDTAAQTYTLTLYNTWNSGQIYGKWTCAADGTEWIKVN